MWNLNFLVTTPLLVLGNPKAPPLSGEVVLDLDQLLERAHVALGRDQGRTWRQAFRDVGGQVRARMQPSSLTTKLLGDVDEEDVDEEDGSADDVSGEGQTATSRWRKVGGAVLYRQGRKRAVRRLRVSYRGQVFRTWTRGEGEPGKLVMPYPVGLHSDQVKVEWATQAGRFRVLKDVVSPELAKPWDITLEYAKHTDDTDEPAKDEAERCARRTKHFFDSTRDGHGTERHHFMHRGNVDEGEDDEINVVFMFPGLNAKHMTRGDHGTSPIADAGFNTWYGDMCRQLAGIQQEFLIVVVAPIYQGHPIMRDLYLEMGIMYTQQYTHQAWVHPVLQELARAGYRPSILFAGISVGAIIATWHAITYRTTQVSSGGVVRDVVVTPFNAQEVVVDPFRAQDRMCTYEVITTNRRLEHFSTSLHRCVVARAKEAGVGVVNFSPYASLDGGLYSLRFLLTRKTIGDVRSEAQEEIRLLKQKILRREETEKTEKRVTLTREKLLQRELPLGEDLQSLGDIMRSHDALKSFTWQELPSSQPVELRQVFSKHA